MPIPFRLDYVIARLSEPAAPSPHGFFSRIRRALSRADHNELKAARLLGLTRAQLRSRIDKYGLTSG